MKGIEIIEKEFRALEELLVERLRITGQYERDRAAVDSKINLQLAKVSAGISITTSHD